MTSPANSPAVAPAGTFGMVMLVCDDIAATRDFYRANFGLKVTEDAPEWIVLELLQGVSLALHPREVENHLEVSPGSTFLSFRVNDTDAFVSAAVARGTRVALAPRDEPFGRFAIVLDPSGYPWQIFTPHG